MSVFTEARTGEEWAGDGDSGTGTGQGAGSSTEAGAAFAAR